MHASKEGNLRHINDNTPLKMFHCSVCIVKPLSRVSFLIKHSLVINLHASVSITLLFIIEEHVVDLLDLLCLS